MSVCGGNGMIRVLICDDQFVVCEGLRTILSDAPDIEVAGVATSGALALELIPRAQPDVVLMDLKMPGMNGIAATRAIRAQFPNVRVLALTTYDADEWVFDAIRAGAAGYLLKEATREALIEAIRGTAAGRTHVDPGVAGKLFEAAIRRNPQADPLPPLTERERDVLRLLARGLSNAEIAGQLHLTEGTVRNYVSALLAKLGVSDRTQAALLAVRSGITEENP
ncbi:MAG: response regulator transcription factor [Chloroflexota bacterium]